MPTPDWNSHAADVERIQSAMADYAARLITAGQGAGADLHDLDAVEALLLDRMAEEPEECRRVLAWCFVVALNEIVRATTDTNPT